MGSMAGVGVVVGAGGGVGLGGVMGATRVSFDPLSLRRVLIASLISSSLLYLH